MRLLIGISFTLFATLSAWAGTPPAPKLHPDVVQIVECMKAGSCRNTLESRGLEFGDHAWIVFTDTSTGTRYAFHWEPTPEHSEGILVVALWRWWKERGPTAPDELFADCNLDGLADYGKAGRSDSQEFVSLTYDSGLLSKRRPPQGLVFRPYWQAQFSAALAAAKRKLFPN